jgi:hypothetical protein
VSAIPKLSEFVALEVDPVLLATLRAYAKAHGQSLHDICRQALGIGFELLRKPRQSGLPGVR